MTSRYPKTGNLPPKEAAGHLKRVLFSRRTVRVLFSKMRHDRIVMRSAALAFETLLSIVPLTAVIMAVVRKLGGKEQQGKLLSYLAEQYVPRSAEGALERILPLIEHLDLSTIGWLGLLALMPVMFSLVDAVEMTLSDIFGTPRRTHWWRFWFLAGLLVLGPLGSVLTVRYVPWDMVAFDHVITPMLVISLMLYGVFRGLPSIEMSDRAALTGALTAGLLLAIAKAGFGLYTTHLATSIHLLWGAVAFVPLLLVWVLLSWATLLIGAEITATVQLELSAIENPRVHRLSRPRRMRSRLRRRIRQRHPDSRIDRATSS